MRSGVTYVSKNAEATSTGTAIATVTKVAASRSLHWPRRLATSQAASGRKSGQLGDRVQREHGEKDARVHLELSGYRRGPIAEDEGLGD